MPIAHLNLRHNVPERMAAFTSGLQECGYIVAQTTAPAAIKPRSGDILVTWNRIYEGDDAARRFIEAGCTVLVTENATWGNDFAGGRWYTIARDFHNQAGRFRYGGPQRWDALGVELQPWRPPHMEQVILAQRGIGPPQTRQPAGWPNAARRRVPNARIRLHPGQRTDCVPLEQDLAGCSDVYTWGSGAAVRALMWGCRVHSSMPQWIGEQDNTDAGRLAMLRRLAWAQWRLSEIASGHAFEHLMGPPRVSDEVQP